MRVLIPTLLRSYTAGAKEITGSGATLADLLDDLEARFPGIRFRIIDEQGRVRTHIRIFVGQEAAQSLDVAISPDQTVQIAGALSGG